MSSTPVIPGFYPDPSVCRVGDEYYLANSSFEYVPGVPVWRSRDLVSWQQVGHALERTSHIPARQGRPSGGIFAPTLRHHGGRFWLTTTDYHRIFDGQLVVWAEDPAGPWSDPVFVPGTLGIDPDLAWDDEGTCHLSWASFHGIRSVAVDPVTGTRLAEPRQLWPGSGMAAPEGPHLYRIDHWWYLLLAEGGTERGHSITMARARTLDGPWEPAPGNPLLTHRSSSHPVQNTGHGDLVQRPDGGWALVYLGVRTRGFSPLFHTNGRETFVAAVDWVDGWPMVVEDRIAVPSADTAFDEDFRGGQLDPRWVGPGRHPESFTEHTPDGLVVRPAPDGLSSQLCTRVRDLAWEAVVELTGHSGRFALRMDDGHWYGLDVTSEEVRAVASIGPVRQAVGRVHRASAGMLALRISATPPPPDAPDRDKHEPDFVTLSVQREDRGWEQLARLPGRYLSTEVTCGFTGRVLAVEPLDGDVALHRFRYSPLEN